ncbi:hypothetical protein [Nocardioides sp. URHA0020]|uniref:hypothetical protein n=1 Tax=Nocardioides sp. URHA0020 TaxID=1380392 RepID=UPI0004907707|nr:hypothetical protein [Nocardioides sp. URHA0020]
MDCDFSEFSYGYAAIREAEAELATIYRSAAAPVLPSLLQEEKLGWDAKLQYVEYCLFLQFKRVEYVSRRHPASPTWSYVGGPHYRFSIDTDGHQHAALVSLESALSTGTDPGHIYYAAPGFHRQHEFDAAYSYGGVLENSHLVSPTEFPSSTGKHHFVADLAGGLQVLSEPRRPERIGQWESMRERARVRATAASNRPRRRDMTLGGLEDAVQESISRLGRDVPRTIDAPITRRLQRSAAALGCGLILLLVDDEDALG